MSYLLVLILSFEPVKGYDKQVVDAVAVQEFKTYRDCAIVRRQLEDMAGLHAVFQCVRSADWSGNKPPVWKE